MGARLGIVALILESDEVFEVDEADAVDGARVDCLHNKLGVILSLCKGARATRLLVHEERVARHLNGAHRKR